MNGFPSTVTGDHALILRAVSIASQAHDGQRRKYTGEPYLQHPLAVAFGVANRTMDPHVIAAAVLHDVLEDTTVTEEELRTALSERVASLVVELTDVYTHEAYPDINRRERKRLERVRQGETSAEAQLIKAYDLLDNAKSILQHDPGFARVYLTEVGTLIPLLVKLDPHEQILLSPYLTKLSKSVD